jgi:hypothetical protein
MNHPYLHQDPKHWKNKEKINIFVKQGFKKNVLEMKDYFIPIWNWGVNNILMQSLNWIQIHWMQFEFNYIQF